jgi:transcriptional regulator with XRE-family HTH domain
LDIIGDPHPLRGQEVRFLRGMMKVSQEGLARVLRQRRGSVARWEAEANKAVPGAADSALRMFYALKAGGARDGGEGGRSVAGERGVEGAGFAVSERWRVDAGGGLSDLTRNGLPAVVSRWLFAPTWEYARHWALRPIFVSKF